MNVHVLDELKSFILKLYNSLVFMNVNALSLQPRSQQISVVKKFKIKFQWSMFNKNLQFEMEWKVT